MDQDWLSVFGLGLDAAGVLCIAAEWFIATWTQQNPKIIEGYSVAPADPHELEKIRLDNKLSRQQEVWERSSQWWFYGAGFSLLIIGFLMQILGNWPGGISILGIHFQ